jgi:hydrogenase maturation protease
LVDALELGKKLGFSVPGEIIIYAIEASDVSTFSEKCTTKVRKSISRCATMVLNEIKQPLC